MLQTDAATRNGHAPDITIQGILPSTAYVVLVRQAGRYFVSRQGVLMQREARAFRQAEAMFKQGTPDGDEFALVILRRAGFDVNLVV